MNPPNPQTPDRGIGRSRHRPMLISTVVSAAVLVALVATTVLVASAAVVRFRTTPELTDGVDDEAFALKVIGDQVWVGGDFTSARSPGFGSPEQARSRLAIFDLNTGDLLPQTLNANARVAAIESDGATVWIGGQFTTLGGQSKQRIAAMNLSSKQFVAGFNGNVNGEVHDLHLHEGWLYVAGDFAGYNSSGKRNMIRIDPQSGLIDRNFSPNPNAPVFSVDAFANEIVLGGVFTRIGPDYARENERYVAAVDASTGVELNKDYDKLGGILREGVDTVMVADDGTAVYVGDRENYVAKYRRSTGQLQWSVRGQGNIQTLGKDGSTIYVGLHDGWRVDGDGQMLVALDDVNGQRLAGFAPEMNSFWGIRGLEVTEQGVVTVGDFTNVVGLNSRRIAIYRPQGNFQPAPPLNPPAPTPTPGVPPTPTPTPTPIPTPTPGPTATPEPTPVPPTPTPTPTPPPIVPVVMAAEVRADESVRLNWSQTASAASYDIAWRVAPTAQNPSPPWQVFDTATAAPELADMARIVRPTGSWNPIPGQPYELALRTRAANNSTGAFSTGVPVEFVSSLTGLRKTGSSSSTISIRWDAVSAGDPFVRYEIFTTSLDGDVRGCLLGSITNRTTTSYVVAQQSAACGSGPLQGSSAYVIGMRIVRTLGEPKVSSPVELIVASTTGGVPLPAEKFGTANVAGTWEIVNSAGNPVVWNAMNLRRGELNSLTYTDAELDSIAAQGFDTLRITMEWDRFERDKGEWDAASFSTLDQTIARAADAGVNVILDPLHLADGPAWQIPDWAWDASNDGMNDDDFVVAAIRDNAIPYLQHVAHRYAGHANVIAIDLINEPREVAGGLANNNIALMGLYTDLIAEVREVEPDKPLILEPYYGSTKITVQQLNFLGSPTALTPAPDDADYTDLIWSMHDYYAGREGAANDDGYSAGGYPLRGAAVDGTRYRTESWTTSGCYPSGPSVDDCTHDTSRIDVTRPSMLRHVKFHYDEAQMVGMPVFIGEYGIPHSGADKPGWGGTDKFLADKISIYDELGVSRAYWSWRTDVDPTFGLYDRSTNQWNPLTQAVGSDADEVSTSYVCADNSGTVEVLVHNMGSGSATYSATIDGTTTTAPIARNATRGFSASTSDGSIAVRVTRSGSQVFSGNVAVDCGSDQANSNPLEVMHVNTCLGGNGRFDTNIVNTGNDSAAYRIEFGGLSARQATVAPGDWWRMPITGRPDREFQVIVKRDGVVVSDTINTISCDTEPPQLDDAEVRVVNSCRAGNGYLLFQFVNDSAASKSYIIEFAGVNNRSTSAAAYGQAVRAVTGRPDGDHAVLIRNGQVPLASLTVTVDCD